MKALPVYLAMALTWPQAWAQDLPSGSPERKAVIAAVRQHPAFEALHAVRLDVRRIWASPTSAYLCAMAIGRDGRYQMSDGLYAVYQVALRRGKGADGQDGGWVPSARIDGLSETIRHVQCHADANGQITDAFLQDMASNSGLKP